MNKLYFGKVNIIGFGESGRAVYKLLKNYNNYIKIFEHGKRKISETKIHYDAINSEIFDCDIVIPSPGVSYSILKKFIEKEILILPEIEIGYYNIDKRRSFLIGITGTNGKTTTSLLIDHILKPFNSMLYGNIGNAFCNNRKNIGLFVLELSSFQLSIVKRFKVNVGIFLNIDYDHIDWHLSFENYLRAKMNIFKNQDENDFKIVNLDDENIIKNLPSVPSRNLYFSIKNDSADCYFKDNKIYLFSKAILNVKEYQTFSLIHNVYNLMASILAVYCYVKNIEVLKKLLYERLGSFKIPEHRLEFV
ncbi:MAG: Mur ligase family protein, partial [candidate division WOR-3 bacterium]|nr:Mur ligase family protein [candidate division WOR-3 bacterium]